ncbi:hypothetical protein [Winogradskyella sp. UBA3174]|uniref:hypothetical protein n=1 Tax=Winogradskyella sp. UBA3174 TaxID=1947785 RepID=UPI0025DF6303|nr:hypothetical protein [Winogradskyella sp. UBA3174]|tara:strand:+ start:1611 stop:2318 length:708 start_codon:yes stop_codon:yes gene_type:complete
MKRLLLLIILTSYLTSFAQNEKNDLLTVVLNKLEIEKADCFDQLITHHDFGNETLFVIPTIWEKGDGYAILNSNIILINNKNHEIIGTFQKNNDLYTDAVRLDKIEIDSSLFRINNAKSAYKLIFSYSNNSKPNPYYTVSMSLFINEKDSLKRILKDYKIETMNGETDTNCQGEFEKHTKQLQIIENSNREFPEIRVLDSIRNFKISENCEMEAVQTKLITDTLRFQVKEYKYAM